MGVEDAGALATLFENISDKSEIPSLLSLYEKIRKPRALKIRQRSENLKFTYTLEDGPEQEARDNALLHGPPTDGWANFLSDPVLRPYTYSYDVIAETRMALKMAKASLSAEHQQQPVSTGERNNNNNNSNNHHH